MYAILDIETTGLSRFENDINYIGVGIAKKLGEDLKEKHIYNMTKDEDITAFKKMCKKLRKHKVRMIYQNGKFDTLFIEWNLGIKLPIHHDIMVMGTAYDLSASHRLDDMAQNYLGVDTYDIPLKEKVKPNNPIVEEYLLKDIEYPWKLFNFFMENMSPEEVKIYKYVLMRPYRMYRNVERNGIYFDTEAYEKVKKSYKRKEYQCLKKLKSYGDINWNSPAQVSKLLFEDMGLPTIKLSPKTGNPSADAKVLKRLSSKGYKVADDILEYKFYYGANTKFLNTWGDYAQYTGRIHPSFGITNVVTGRTSCSNPNLQQVPRNKELRTLFSAPPGRVLIEADYSQIELRIAAHYADEETMLEIYRTGGDIHTQTAMSMSGKSAEEVQGELRSKAKAVNFGFLYGMGAKGFVGYAFDSYNVVFNNQEAEDYRNKFFSTYSKLEDWHKCMGILCELHGGVSNLFGQFRSLPDIFARDMYTKSKAIRRAINTPVQGTASVLLMTAAAEIDTKMTKKYDIKLVGTIHDAVLVEAPEDRVEEVCEELKRIMSKPEILDTFNIDLKVPIVADVDVGPWGS